MNIINKVFKYINDKLTVWQLKFKIFKINTKALQGVSFQLVDESKYTPIEKFCEGYSNKLREAREKNDKYTLAIIIKEIKEIEPQKFKELLNMSNIHQDTKDIAIMSLVSNAGGSEDILLGVERDLEQFVKEIKWKDIFKATLSPYTEGIKKEFPSLFNDSE
jgi:hypothetical protein